MNDAAPAKHGAWQTWRAPVLAAAVVLVAAIASIVPAPVGVFWDDGVYLLTARALAAGEGYRYTYLPGMPPAIHYPPGYPALLALLWKMTPEFPRNLPVLRLLNPCLLAIGVAGVARLGARRLPLGPVAPAMAAAIAALVAPVLVLTNVLLSESLFFALLAWTLVVADGAVEEGGIRRGIVAGVLCGSLALVRTVGGVLLPAMVVALWWRGRRREALAAALVTSAMLAPWQWWVWSAARHFPDLYRGSYGPYLEWVIGGYRADPSLLPQVLARNAADLWRAFGVITATRLPVMVQGVAAALLLAALVAGIVSLARRAPVVAFFLAFYGAVVLAWPYNPERFTWAVWPLAGIVVLAGAIDAGNWLAPRWPFAPRVGRAIAMLLLAGQAAYAARGLAAGWASAPQRAMAERLWPLVEWTGTHAGPDDLVASDAHVMLALYTGLRTMPVSMLTPAEHVRRKPLPQFATELAELDQAFHPSLIVLSAGTAEIDAVPLLAAGAGAPALVALPPLPGGGTAFALRRGK